MPKPVQTVVPIVAVLLAVQPTLAQSPVGEIPLLQPGPMDGATPSFRSGVLAAPLRAGPASERGPLARLVRNPATSGGLPPYALADQGGVVQRYVEPIPGIDLEPFVGQVIAVRHDTGRTLLASQLELPSRPILSIADAAGDRAGTAARRAMPPNSTYPVRPARFVEDEFTVELIEEGPVGAWPSGPPRTVGAEFGAADHHHHYDGYDSAGYDPHFAEPYPAGYELASCPSCGGCCCRCQLDATPPFVQQGVPRFYGSAEISLLRAHLTDEPFGKLSETYDFSPRAVLGFHDLENLSGRFRFWHYDQATRSLEGGSIHLSFDVFDLEATHHFAGKRSEVLLAGGLRFARIKLNDLSDAQARSVMPGLTLAADGRTHLMPLDRGRLSWVYGGRLSILGGDWRGDANDFTGGTRRDDNLIVHEIYIGLEYAVPFENCHLHARAAFEMQNWHSDILAQNAGIDSIGFLGPGLLVGASF